MSREITRIAAATIGALATFAVTNNIPASVIAPAIVYLVDQALYGSLSFRASLPSAAAAFTAYVSLNITDDDATAGVAGLVAYGLARTYTQHLENRNDLASNTRQVRPRNQG